MKFTISETTTEPRKRKWRENNRDKYLASVHAARTAKRAAARLEKMSKVNMEKENT